MDERLKAGLALQRRRRRSKVCRAEATGRLFPAGKVPPIEVCFPILTSTVLLQDPEGIPEEKNASGAAGAERERAGRTLTPRVSVPPFPSHARRLTPAPEPRRGAGTLPEGLTELLKLRMTPGSSS